MRALLIAVFWVGAEIVRAQSDTFSADYCSVDYQCQYKQHLRCEFPAPKVTPDCPVREFKMSPDRRRDLLQHLNDFRNSAAAGDFEFWENGAANMRQLSWDYELELFAMTAAAECKWIDKNLDVYQKCTKTKEFKDGTSLWKLMLDELSVRMFFTEVAAKTDVATSIVDKFALSESYTNEFDYTNLTLLIWADSYKVGCTFMECTCDIDAVITWQTYLCFFGPKGNVVGQPVFKKGDACSSCPKDTKCHGSSKWKYLCASSKDAREPMDVPDVEFPIEVSRINAD